MDHVLKTLNTNPKSHNKQNPSFLLQNKNDIQNKGISSQNAVIFSDEDI